MPFHPQRDPTPVASSNSSALYRTCPSHGDARPMPSRLPLLRLHLHHCTPLPRLGAHGGDQDCTLLTLPTVAHRQMHFDMPQPVAETLARASAPMAWHRWSSGHIALADAESSRATLIWLITLVARRGMTDAPRTEIADALRAPASDQPPSSHDSHPANQVRVRKALFAPLNPIRPWTPPLSPAR